MGKHVVRQTPKAMPSAEKVAECNAGLAQPFLVAGCRGQTNAENRSPDFVVHGSFRFAAGSVEQLEGTHTIVFVHGYNLTSQEGLDQARDLFGKLHTALVRDGADPRELRYLLFTWPGDTGTVYFNDAQAYAQISGVALYELLRQADAKRWSLVTHSLGAHVALRAAAILGERHFRGKGKKRVDRALLLAASVEDDVFERPQRHEEYHFPEAAFGIRRLHISSSRSDEVLAMPFRLNEFDAALGYCGPQTMDPLVSLARRVRELSVGTEEDFEFELHDFSPNSATILNPQLHVRSHGGYWDNTSQLDYYVNLIR
jgi:esterase/lipase superfamily enzyme